jgi:Alpha-2-macroglobulin bait region domain
MPLNVLNYAVIGRFGLIGGDQEYCNDERECEITISAEASMLPQVTVVVYYKNKDSRLMHDVVTVRFEGFSENYVSQN